MESNQGEKLSMKSSILQKTHSYRYGHLRFFTDAFKNKYRDDKFNHDKFKTL